MWLQVAIAAFALLEVTNVVTLYVAPGSRKANGVGVFTAWEASKADPDIHAFVRYLVYWVAGTKLIFLGLLLVILVTAPERTTIAAAGVLALSIASFFWRLFPLARGMDRRGQMVPSGYSGVLGVMIGAMVAVLGLGAAIAGLTT
jgi:hypothetical protein